MVPHRALIFALASSLAMSLGCGADAAPSDKSSADDDSTGDTTDKDEGTGGERVDASVNKADSSTRIGSGRASDAGGKPGNDDRVDAGDKDANVKSLDASKDAGTDGASADSDTKDAASGPANDGGNNAPGQCNDASPHGCYVPQPGNHPMCPAQSPEQSASYPPMAEWKGCNGIMTSAPFTLDPDAKCAYKGPAGEVATCLCDTDLHWICRCGGSGSWPVCTAS
jgi:hypothetical protein